MKEVSLKSELNRAVIIYFNVRVILVEASGTRSPLDFSNSSFALISTAKRNLYHFWDNVTKMIFLTT